MVAVVLLFTRTAPLSKTHALAEHPRKVIPGEPAHGVGNCGAGARAVSAYPTNTLTDPLAARAAPAGTNQVDAAATANRADTARRSLRNGCFFFNIRFSQPLQECLM
jgi:hypothetical protein